MPAPGDLAQRLPKPGELWAEKYRILGLVGAGAMGCVLAAEHLLLGGRVALKFMADEGASSGARFMREARSAQALASEHVVRVFDVGVERGLPYLVMELLEGTDLAAWLRRTGPLPVPEAVDYVLQACAGVAAAHAQGIVHRDLKPSNLFRTLRTNGRPLIKVLDFGISKELERVEREATAPRSLLGSPHYMSPEQLRNPRSVDARTDVWSLAVTLYTLLRGEPPFVGENVAELSISIATDEPKSLREAAPEVPRALELVLLEALEKRPEARIASVVELARRLVAFASPGGKLVAEQLTMQFGSAPIDGTGRAAETPREGSRLPELAGELTLTDAGERPQTPREGARSASDPGGARFASSPARALWIVAFGGACALIVWRLSTAEREPQPGAPPLDVVGRLVNSVATVTPLAEVSARTAPEPLASVANSSPPSRVPPPRDAPSRVPRTASSRPPAPSAAPGPSAAAVGRGSKSAHTRAVNIDGFPIVD